MSAENKLPQAQAERNARRRAELILKVRNHECTVTAAAVELGVSRKNYYRGEKRGLEALASPTACVIPAP